MPIIAGVICDKCGKMEIWEHSTKRDIRQFARDEGWTFGKRILCSTCADIEGTHRERRHNVA